MKRPYLMLYVADWQSNAKLRSSSYKEQGIWLNTMFILHDQEEYGIIRWPLKELAQALKVPVSALRNLVTKEILKGADVGAICKPFTYRPRSGGKEGPAVTLIEEQPGPIWYSSRMVRDEHKRRVRGETDPSPKQQPKVPPKGGIGTGLSAHPSRARASISDPDPEVLRDVEDQNNLRVVDAVDRQQQQFPEPDTRGFPFDNFAVVEYIKTLQPDPPLSIFQAETIANGVPDTQVGRAVWTDVLTLFRGNGYQARLAGNAVDRFKREMAAINAGKKDSPLKTERQKTIREQIDAGEIE